MSFQTLSSAYIQKHQYFTARKDSYKTPTGKIVDPYFVVELPTSACALAVTKNGEFILVKQFRYPINQECIEIPGGFVDASEPKEHAIQRELLEETGFKFKETIYLGITYANPGILNNATHLFLCTGGEKVTTQSLDENEEIEILLKSKSELLELLNNGAIMQSMHELCIIKGLKWLEDNCK
jgi:ADP-ribose pyrophosphatase